MLSKKELIRIADEYGEEPEHLERMLQEAEDDSETVDAAYARRLLDDLYVNPDFWMPEEDVTMVKPYDKNNLDGEYGASAIPLEWPEGLSAKAWNAINYFDDTAALFIYQGKFIITDESCCLTMHGSGRVDDPMGFPRAEFDTKSEIGPWLESVCDDLR